jgi:Transposase, Mutator family
MREAATNRASADGKRRRFTSTVTPLMRRVSFSATIVGSPRIGSYPLARSLDAFGCLGVGTENRFFFFNTFGRCPLGFWKAIEEVFPGTRHQRCWVHKTANVLNKVALSVQVNMKADLREVYGAPTRAAAEAAIDVFADKYGGANSAQDGMRPRPTCSTTSSASTISSADTLRSVISARYGVRTTGGD